jgi:1-acyl-sn-glycerol-3-phosphate acyltransferase
LHSRIGDRIKMNNGAPDVNNDDANDARPAKTASAKSQRVLPQWAIQTIANVCWAFSRVLWRISYKGIEHIPHDGRGLVVIANHQTYIDPIWLGTELHRKTRYLAWDAAFTWPVVGWLMGLVGAWPLQIERGNPTTVRRSVQWLRDGGALVIFPEGGRCFADGEIHRFKQGAFRMAIEGEARILPATIRGGERVWPRDWRFPRFRKVEVEFHPPREIVCEPDEETRDCARRAAEEFQQIVAAGNELKR